MKCRLQRGGGLTQLQMVLGTRPSLIAIKCSNSGVQIAVVPPCRFACTPVLKRRSYTEQAGSIGVEGAADTRAPQGAGILGSAGSRLVGWGSKFHLVSKLSSHFTVEDVWCVEQPRECALFTACVS